MSFGSFLILCFLLLNAPAMATGSRPQEWLQLQDFAHDLTANTTDYFDDQCPTWFTSVSVGDSVWCNCDGSVVQHGSVVRCPSQSEVCMQNCEDQEDYSIDSLNVSILTGFCMTHNFETEQTLLALCPYNIHDPVANASKFFITLPSNVSELNDFMCGVLNREGDLCDHCINSTGPSIRETGVKCFPVQNSALNWFYVALCELLPPTCFFFVLLFCKLRPLKGPLNAFIFFCQVFSSIIVLQRTAFKNAFDLHSSKEWSSAAEVIRTTAYEAIGMFYTFWYNQFFWSINFAASNDISVIQIMALGYFSALFPLFLVMMSAIVIKLYNTFEGSAVVAYSKLPFLYCANKLRIRFRWNPINSIIHAFATFILLSYTKVLLVSFNLLAPTRIYNQSGELDYKIMSYDASIHFLGHRHVPYVVLALSMLTLFCGLPLLLLCLYPTSCFQKLLVKLKVPSSFHWKLETFTDAYTGCYRNFTDSGRLDCRYFAALYLLFRIIYFSFIFFVRYSYMWLSLILLSLAISFVFAIVQPYREKWLNVVDSVYFLLASVVILLYAYDIYIDKIPMWLLDAFITLPFLYFMAFISYKIYFKVRRCCKKCCPNRGVARDHEAINGEEEERIDREGEPLIL